MSQSIKVVSFAAVGILFFASIVVAQRGIGVVSRNAPSTEQRLALVIGNSAYKRISRLRNPGNDAKAIQKVLTESGFQVTLLVDADRRDMLRAIEGFGKKLRKGGVGLFYFAGHGVQARGRNYLVPLAARVEGAADLEYEAVDAGRVLAKMENAQNRLNIVILDACRNNPYGGTFRSARKGLAQVSAPTGSLVAYATAPGKVAADGEGRNGLYTEQLIRHIRTPGLKLEEVFKRVRGDVRRRSGGKQVPWENTSVEGDFYFIRAGSSDAARVTAAKPRTKAPARTIDEEEEFWTAIKNSKDVEDFQAYLDEYPGGRFAGIAKLKIRQLQRKAQPKQDQTAAICTDSGSTWRDPVTGMDFVKVPGGSFQMGCIPGDTECERNEIPVRTVQLDGFWLSKYEVTQGQWKRIMGNNPSEFKKGDNYPVELVSWNNAQEFIRKLNAKSSSKFRLPSEAQWEFACRAGGKPIIFGTGTGKVLPGNANYEGNNEGSTPVGKYQTNSMGLHDMSGNVNEWVQDKFTGYGNVGTNNPIYEDSGSYRVGRGGSWLNRSRYLRCSRRGGYGPTYVLFTLGFRLIRTN